MPVQNPSHATVKHTLITTAAVAKGVTALTGIVTAGTSSADVQGSPLAKQALAGVQTASAALASSLNTRISLANALAAAIKAVGLNVTGAATALRAYEAAVNVLAGGNAQVINGAGLLARDEKTPEASLGVVTGVSSKPGKLVTQAILSWPEVDGATSFAIEVNLTPANPAGTWTALTSATSRRRVVTGPAPASQLLARVAAIASDGTQSDWSAPVLVTTR